MNLSGYPGDRLFDRVGERVRYTVDVRSARRIDPHTQEACTILVLGRIWVRVIGIPLKAVVQGVGAEGNA